jgi:hypothetical protein
MTHPWFLQILPTGVRDARPGPRSSPGRLP